jgi:hypothetical protein
VNLSLQALVVDTRCSFPSEALPPLPAPIIFPSSFVALPDPPPAGAPAALREERAILEHYHPPPFAPYPPLPLPDAFFIDKAFFSDKDAMVFDENSHLKRSHRATRIIAGVAVADKTKKFRTSLALTTRSASRQQHESRHGYEANPEQELKLICASTMIQRWWRVQKQIALNGIDTADYYGEAEDDDMLADL